jgi:hypothetical protein
MQEKRVHIIVENLSRLKANDKVYKNQRKESFCQTLKTRNLIYLDQRCEEKQLLKSVSAFIKTGLKEFVFYFDDVFSVNDVRNVIPLVISLVKAKHLDADFHYACMSLKKMNFLKRHKL